MSSPDSNLSVGSVGASNQEERGPGAEGVARSAGTSKTRKRIHSSDNDVKLLHSECG